MRSISDQLHRSSLHHSFVCLQMLVTKFFRAFCKLSFFFYIFLNSFDALEGPLGARSKELEDQVKFFQFNRDVDDELVL